jgi:hypothetical protein
MLRPQGRFVERGSSRFAKIAGLGEASRTGCAETELCKPPIDEGGYKVKGLIAAVLTVIVLALSGVALADPGADSPGCHGAATTEAKGADRGVQGSAIGGLGNSDGDAANGQAHSDPGRGELVQDFLGTECGVGSER